MILQVALDVLDHLARRRIVPADQRLSIKGELKRKSRAEGRGAARWGGEACGAWRGHVAGGSGGGGAGRPQRCRRCYCCCRGREEVRCLLLQHTHKGRGWARHSGTVVINGGPPLAFRHVRVVQEVVEDMRRLGGGGGRPNPSRGTMWVRGRWMPGMRSVRSMRWWWMREVRRWRGGPLVLAS